MSILPLDRSQWVWYIAKCPISNNMNSKGAFVSLSEYDSMNAESENRRLVLKSKN